jgi:hypothetical protein
MTAKVRSARKKRGRRLAFKTARVEITPHPAAATLQRSSGAAPVFVTPIRRPGAKVGELGFKVEGEAASLVAEPYQTAENGMRFPFAILATRLPIRAAGRSTENPSFQSSPRPIRQSVPSAGQRK